MRKDIIFKIVYPQKVPVYVFSKSSWVGLANTFSLQDSSDGIIIPLNYRQFIKEWFFVSVKRFKNRR
jgi:hypothetical protein